MVDSSSRAQPSNADPHEAKAKPEVMDPVLEQVNEACSNSRRDFAKKYPNVPERKNLTCQCFHQALVDDGRMSLARASLRFMQHKEGQPPLKAKNHNEQGYLEQAETLKNYCLVDASWTVKDNRPPIDYNRKMKTIQIQMGVVKNPSRF